jgi:hypothetical protein
VTYPFFGGPWDGEFHEADSDCCRVIVKEPVPLDNFTAKYESLLEVKTVVYHRYRLILNSTYVTVYILEGLTTFDMFKMMLDKYFNRKKD